MTGPYARAPTVELRQFGGDGEALPALICAPHAGGGAALFRTWPKALPRIAVHVLDLPGRDARFDQPPFTRLDTLVASAADAILPLSRRPFALFGHSMGALILFETARLLRRRGVATPEHLFVSSFRAPHLPCPKPRRADMPDAMFVEEIRRINKPAFDPAEHAELLELMLPTLRADFRLVESYAFRPEPPLGCPITACGGSDDSEISEQELREWRHHTSETFDLMMLPGGHAYLQTQERTLLGRIHHVLAGRAAFRAGSMAAVSGVQP